MNKDQKKQSLLDYRNRKSDRGILAVRCTTTEELFLGASKDIKADTNSTRFKLQMGNHPNKMLQSLWNTHGEQSFHFTALALLAYDDPQTDHTNELEELLQAALVEYAGAQRIWR